MNTLASVFDWLLAASLRASVLTVAVLVVQWLLRHHLSPRWRHALWLPVLVVLLTPVFPESSWSLGSTWRAAQEQPQVISVPPVQMPVMDLAGLAGTPVSAAAAPAATVNWPHVAMLVWLAGTVVLLLGGAVSFSRVLLRFKAARLPVNDKLQTLIAETVQEVGLRCAPQVWISPGVSSPAVAGLLRPVLLLPAEFDHAFTLAEVRLILRHELTHLKRHDLPVNALMCLLIALHWFNPVLWLAFFKVRADRETACDSQVLAHATHAGRVEYGHALLKVESAFSPLSLSLGFVGIFQRGAALRSRIRSIAVQRRATPFTSLLTTGSMLLMTFFGITRAQTPDTAAKEALLVALEVKIVEVPKGADLKLEALVHSKELPPLAILTEKERNIWLRQFITDPKATVTSYPRMITRAGQEVAMKSIVNQPYKSADGKVLTHPIGLVWKMVPTLLPGGRIRLQSNIHHSEILDPAAEPPATGLPSLHSFDHQTSVELHAGLSALFVAQGEGKAARDHTRIYLITPQPVDPEKGGLAVAAAISPGVTASLEDTHIGKSMFRAGDLIRITSVSRDDKMLNVSFDYELASAERATLTLSITSLTENTGRTPDRRQTMEVRKGTGSGTLQQLDPYPGLPHLTFYNTENQSAIGGLYFGTAAEAAASQKLDLAYMLKDGDTTDMLKTGGADAIKAIHAKLQTIIVPKVQFNGATLQEAVEFMRVQSAELDPAADKGVRFLLLQNNTSAGVRMSLDLRDVPLNEMLRYVTELGNVKYLVTPKEVVIASAEDLKKHILTSPSSRPLTKALIARAAQPATDRTDAATPVQKGAAAQPPGVQIILPEVKLRDTRFDEAIELIQTKARELDPTKKGVPILIRAGGKAETPITLDLKDVQVLQAVKYIAELAHYNVTVEAYGIVLQPQGQ